MHATSHTPMRGPSLRTVQTDADGNTTRVTIRVPRQGRSEARRRAITESLGGAR